MAESKVRAWGGDPVSRETGHLCLGAGSDLSDFEHKVPDSLEGLGMIPRVRRPLSNMPGPGCQLSKSCITEVGGYVGCFSPIQTSAEVPDVGHWWKDICLLYKPPERLGLACSTKQKGWGVLAELPERFASLFPEQSLALGQLSRPFPSWASNSHLHSTGREEWEVPHSLLFKMMLFPLKPKLRLIRFCGGGCVYVHPSRETI